MYKSISNGVGSIKKYSYSAKLYVLWPKSCVHAHIWAKLFLNITQQFLANSAGIFYGSLEDYYLLIGLINPTYDAHFPLLIF